MATLRRMPGSILDIMLDNDRHAPILKLSVISAQHNGEFECSSKDTVTGRRS